MKAKTFIRRSWLLVTPILIAMFGGLLFLTGTHHQIGNPYIYATVSETTSWGKRVDLTNNAIPAGTKKENLENRIRSYGFERLAVIPEYRDIEPGEEVWVKVVSGVPCRVEYSLFLSFDSNNNVETAYGSQNANVCL